MLVSLNEIKKVVDISITNNIDISNAEYFYKTVNKKWGSIGLFKYYDKDGKKYLNLNLNKIPKIIELIDTKNAFK